MEKETVQIIRVETGKAVTSIKELKTNIKELKDRLQDMEIGSTEYKETLDKIRVSQNALKDAMYASSQSMPELAAAAKGTTASYNSLVHKMAELKQEIRSVDTSTDEGVEHFNALAKEISGINDKLKAMDAAQGNFQRNVGNYMGLGNKWVKNLSDVSQGMAAAGAGTKEVTAAMKLLSATPAVMILGVIAGLLTKTTDALKGSEEGLGSATEAMALFGGVSESITKLLQGLAQGIAWVGEKMAGLYKQVFGETEAMKTRQEVIKGNIELAKQERETTILNAEAERDIAELREKATDKEKYTASERLAFQKRAGELENEIAKRAAEDLKVQYELIKKKNSLTKSSAEDLKKEADAYAAMVQAETDYLNKMAGNNRKLDALRKEEEKDARDAAKMAQDALKSRIKAEEDLLSQEIELTEKGTEQRLALEKERRAKEYELAVFDAKTKIKVKEALNKTLLLLERKYAKDLELLERESQLSRENQEHLHLQNLANIHSQGTREYLEAIRDLRARELADIQQEEGETEAEFNARRIAAQKAYYDSLRALNEKSLQESTAELRLALARETEGTEGYYAGKLALAESYYKNLLRLEGESETEYLIRQEEARKAYSQAADDLISYQEEQERLRMENDVRALQEGSTMKLQAMLALKEYELDTLHQFEGESEEEFRARQLAAEEEYRQAKADIALKAVDDMQLAANLTKGILGAIADMYEADTESAKKNAKKVKALRIASATIETIAGAAGAFATAAANPGGIPGMIIGAANAAIVTATGIAQIAKMKKTDETGGTATSSSPSIPAVTSAPSTTRTVPQVRNITSASEEERLNRIARDKRVVLVTSDLEVQQNQQRVQVQESSF